MKRLSLLCALLAFPLLPQLPAAEPAPSTSATAQDPRTAKLSAADDARVAAMLSADTAKLAGIFSDDLRYAHSSGVVDTKASLIEGISARKTKYEVFEYKERNFTFPAPGIALMTGRSHLKAVSATSGPIEFDMGFLGVWREEGGQWRFIAWQSCKLPAPASAPVAPEK